MSAVERVPLRDGSVVIVRPITPGDKDRLEAAVEHLTPESRYRRFLAPLRHLSRSELAYFTEVDHRSHEALVACPASDPARIVGVARYIASPAAEDAEVAVAVDDPWQGKGVATALLARLVEHARAAGVRRFVATCLSDNRDVVDVLSALGPTRRAHSDPGLLELEIDLCARASAVALAER